MPTIITEKFRQSNATAFSNDISTSKYYMFLGKSQTWESEGSSSDTQPPVQLIVLHQNHTIGMICWHPNLLVQSHS